MVKNYKISETFYLLLSVIFSLFFYYEGISQHDHNQHTIKSSDIPLDRIKNDCRFFLGDTLNGFALEATIESGIKKFDIYSELKWYVSTKEKEFVKSKYNIKKLGSETLPVNNRLYIS